MLIFVSNVFLPLEFEENSKSDFRVSLLKIFVIVNSSFALEILNSFRHLKDFWMLKQFLSLTSSWHEHESCLSIKENMGKSEDSQVWYSWGKFDQYLDMWLLIACYFKQLWSANMAAFWHV